MRVVGVTGGIASGKSLVLRAFMRLGAYGIDCDVLSREVVTPCSKAWWQVVRRFGSEILSRDLEIDRKKLRAVVFRDPEKLRVLEKIIHPKVRAKCVERLEAVKKLSEGAEAEALVVVDVPLLIEKRLQEEFDKIILVFVGEATQTRRLTERSAREGETLTREEAKKMISLQTPLKEKLRFADFVINNEGTVEETEEQVRSVFATLTLTSRPAPTPQEQASQFRQPKQRNGP